MQTLYKKTNTGAIQFWTISVSDNTIVTEYGQVGTENPQVTHDIILRGKNEGRANGTTPQQQAILEAEAKWKKQLKKGYVTSVTSAQGDEVDDIIEGGVLPMLSHKYADHAKKIKFPCFGQPKLDGIRCTAVMGGNGTYGLWTRTRKPILSMPHIIKDLTATVTDGTTLDGELYNHDYRDDFENIISLVRPDEPVEGHEVVQFHIYDMVVEHPFENRIGLLQSGFRNFLKNRESLVLVDTREIKSAADVMPFHDEMVALGYEGAMLRNAAGLYVNKRSYDLQKVKVFETDEFEIVGFEEGRGRLAEHVGSFICRMKDGKNFLAKQKGSLERLREYFLHHEMWEGKKLTVQYQNLTAAGLPRFPIGIAIRDYE